MSHLMLLRLKKEAALEALEALEATSYYRKSRLDVPALRGKKKSDFLDLGIARLLALRQIAWKPHLRGALPPCGAQHLNK